MRSIPIFSFFSYIFISTFSLRFFRALFSYFFLLHLLGRGTRSTSYKRCDVHAKGLPPCRMRASTGRVHTVHCWTGHTCNMLEKLVP
jgi:hypothetical protein